MVKSGQTIVASAGTAVILADEEAYGGTVIIKALGGNGGMMYVGDDGTGDVSSTTGYELDAGNSIVLENVQHLGSIWVDAGTNGEGVSWILKS